jgi:hypothetical protein
MKTETKYAIKKDGKYLSSLFPITFGSDEPTFYWYYVKEVAANIAMKLNANVEVI